MTSEEELELAKMQARVKSFVEKAKALLPYLPHWEPETSKKYDHHVHLSYEFRTALAALEAEL
jgi:hypothetical protein